MRFLAIQTDPQWLDVAENRRRIEGALDASGFGRGDFVVLPEMCETAWTSDPAHLSGPRDSIDWLSDLARARGVWLQAGFAEHGGDGRLANAVAVIAPDGACKGVYRKNFLFPSERRAFEPGRSLLLVDVGEARVCPLVCYDLRFPELWRLAALAGAEVFTVSSSWPAPRHEHWRALLVARAIENQAFVVAANRCGTDPSNRYLGGSVAITAFGERTSEAAENPTAISMEFDREALDGWRTRFPALGDVRRGLLGAIDVVRV